MVISSIDKEASVQKEAFSSEGRSTFKEKNFKAILKICKDIFNDIAILLQTLKIWARKNTPLLAQEEIIITFTTPLFIM
jgi:hypothetical protein